MSSLIFIRHGETDLAGTFCGHSDPPLNDAGRQQSRTLAASLAHQSFKAIYASDLRRAIETADSLAQVSALPVVTRPHLREIYFGEWEGLTWHEIEKRDAEEARRWLEAYPSLAASNGEPFASFENRVLDEVNHLLSIAEESNEQIAVVTHGGVMRVVLTGILGYTQQRAWEMARAYCSSFVCPVAAVRESVSR